MHASDGQDDPAPSTYLSSFLRPLGPFPKELGPRMLEYARLYCSEHRSRLEAGRRPGETLEPSLSPLESREGCLVSLAFTQGQWGLMGIETQAQSQLT